MLVIQSVVLSAFDQGAIKGAFFPRKMPEYEACWQQTAKIADRIVEHLLASLALPGQAEGWDNRRRPHPNAG